MSDSIKVGLTKMGDPVRRAGLNWELEDISARLWGPACNAVSSFHHGEPSIQNISKAEPLALWEWTSREPTSNVATHLIALALEQYLGLNSKLKDSLMIFPDPTVGAVLGRLILFDADKCDNVQRVVYVERISVGNHEFFRPSARADHTGELRITATKKVLARMRDWVNNEEKGKDSRVGKRGTVKKIDPVVVPDAGEEVGTSKNFGVCKLSEFALLREAARIIRVEWRTLHQAVESGRLKSYMLAGGRKVVNINECKLLWPSGGSGISGRHVSKQIPIADIRD